MVVASRDMAIHCFDTLVAHYSGDKVPPPAFSPGHFPLFVTWKKVGSGGERRLRGCIGTLEARCIHTGFRDYALTSALRDKRFPPIKAKEVPFLEVTVSVLTNHEPAKDHLDWEIGKHGMVIEFVDQSNTRRSATYLPEIPAQEGWTKLETIDSLIKKSGYYGPITETLRKQLQVTRYQSSIYTMHYSEYLMHVQLSRGKATPVLVY